MEKALRILHKLRRFFFGLNDSDLKEIIKAEREANKNIRVKREEMEAIKNRPIPKCDGTY